MWKSAYVGVYQLSNLKVVVFVLHIGFLYVKTADDKLSIVDGDNKA